MNEALHFIEHGEYGMALEELKFVYDENTKSPSNEVLAEMFELAKAVEMKLE
ncbi:MAG: hypothetical protein JWM88_251 [Verrucomicrobia bacterium]|nr:hypothetical protein [Verrucomicrobiota bacterium]